VSSGLSDEARHGRVATPLSITHHTVSKIERPSIGLKLTADAPLFVMLELQEAVGRILAAVPPARHEEIPVSEAHGRVLGQSVLSPMDLPPFDNSAMDGYAVRAEDVQLATKDTPVGLRLAGVVAAGEVYQTEVGRGSCVRLFTGSPLPARADSVVMQEDTRRDTTKPGYIQILDSCRPWENVRLKGEDVRSGASLALEGQALTAGHLCLLSAVGVQRVLVGHLASVGVIATGSELRNPGELLKPGQIYESNRIGLAALIRRAGGKPVMSPVVPDTPEATEQTLANAFSQCDIVVSAGGASVGDFDLIKPSFARLGGELDYWRVAIKPGRPFAFGRFRGKMFFGLPGNPVSALVTFLLLVWPALRRWQGATDTGLRAVWGVLAEEFANPGSRRHFVRVRIDADGKIRSAGAQASHLLSSFANAGGLVDVPPHTTLPVGAGVTVKVWET
jgi:molybdopterin molybdotransferase